MIPPNVQVVLASTLVKSVGCVARIVDRYYRPSSVSMEETVAREAGLLTLATLLNLAIQKVAQFSGPYALLKRAALTVPGIALAEVVSRWVAYTYNDLDDAPTTTLVPTTLDYWA